MKFEDAGRALDQEVEKLKQFLERRVKPTTRRDMARLLRQASRSLARLAQNLEKPER